MFTAIAITLVVVVLAGLYWINRIEELERGEAKRPRGTLGTVWEVVRFVLLLIGTVLGVLFVLGLLDAIGIGGGTRYR